MIATTRGLAILAGVALSLLVLVLVVGVRERAPVDRALLPGFDPATASELRVVHGAEPIRLVRVGDEWRFAGSNYPVDPATLDGVFTALRAGRWHRRAPADAVAELGLADQQVLAIGQTTFALGRPHAGTGQTWITRTTPDGASGLLVDDWITRALFPAPLALRVRHPLACADVPVVTATTSEGTLRIEGRRLVEPRALWLDDRVLAQLADACAGIEIVALGDTRAGQDGFRFTAHETALVETGPCPGGRVGVRTSSGDGCIEAGALQALRDAVRSIITRPEEAIDLRPLPIGPVTLTLTDGSALDLATRRIGDQDADPDAVRELVLALTTRGRAATPRRAGRKPRATLRATDRAGTEVVLEIVDDAIGRAGEPSLIRIDARDLAIVMRPGTALRDATRWREDATTISSITLDGVSYRRGAVLGEWTRTPAGAFDPSVVDALAETLATMRAPAAAPPRTIRHRLSVTFAPPVGAATTHAIELAPPAGDGCAGRIDGVPVRLSLPLCTAVVALAATR